VTNIDFASNRRFLEGVAGAEGSWMAGVCLSPLIIETSPVLITCIICDISLLLQHASAARKVRGALTGEKSR
jgi:hypothetical protein